ncbi:MAG TPA: metallophosphoesterase [Mucilaginibacter sp.]|jgi:predicted phosphodiesterase|nr:metallophosphoesterase [Mucilaginibacter sp.]
MSSYPDTKRSRPVFKTAALDDQEKFQPLPLPTGKYPFRLNIKSVLPDLSDKKMVFHMAGDTGGLVQPVYKHRVAQEMIKQRMEAASDEDRPQFFFHLGDVVYNYGHEEEYYPQFFEPYRHYPCPIFAIPGNHDADIDPFDTRKRESLEAFVQVFCDTESKAIPFAGDSGRVSNIQPNVYYTLKTPLANIIALYSNVPRFGTVLPEQRAWFIEELKEAQAEHKALIVCLHHSAYSADTNHGSSLNMQLFLQSAFEEAGVFPDIVISGHVHNYQRFTKTYPDGRTIPFIVAGAGGYADLHRIARPDDPAYPDTHPQLDNVLLENYCDHTHGFLKMTLERVKGKITLAGEYFILSAKVNNTDEARLFDFFMVNIGE